MAKEEKYGVRSLKKDFPDDETCLDFIFTTLHSKQCSCGGTYSPIKGRRQFQCSRCRFQIAPTAGTIFHKSDTPLTLWFRAIHVFSNAKSGISSSQMERELEVTYKTAWRILNLIRKALRQDDDLLSGDVEMDSAYFGGVVPSGRDNKNLGKSVAAKTHVMGAAQRGGRVRAEVIPDHSAKTHKEFLDNNVQMKGTRLLTDGTNRLKLAARGYKHEFVTHRFKEFARGDVHVNRVESFWSHVKRSMKGVHKSISKQHFQTYLDGFVWHRNSPRNDRERFALLLETVLLYAR